MPVKIFFCYAREDELLLNKLKTHLPPLQRGGLIEVWYDRDISAGGEWEAEIKQHLNTAQIVLLLISPDFMNSDYCYGKEMQWALERHVKGEATVIPIILEYVYWQVEPLKKLQVLPSDAKPVASASWHSQNEALFNVAEGIRLVVEQLNPHPVTASPVVSNEIPQEVVNSNVITRSLQQQNKLIARVSPSTLKELVLLRTLSGHTAPVRSIAMSPDSQTLVSGSQDSTIKVWRLAAGRAMRTLTNHTGFVQSVAISPNNQTLVSGSQDSTIKVWGLGTGKEIRTLFDRSVAWSLAISSDSQMLVSGGSDGTIKIWNLVTGEELRKLTAHKDSLYGVAISPDEQMLVSCSQDSTIKVWGYKQL